MYQMLTNDDEVCIPSMYSSILLDVRIIFSWKKVLPLLVFYVYIIKLYKCKLLSGLCSTNTVKTKD